MKATDFTRDDCKLGKRRVSYDRLTCDYCCNDCGGKLTAKWEILRGWYVACGRCGSTDFVHEAEYERQKADAYEVLEGLPDELREFVERRPG